MRPSRGSLKGYNGRVKAVDNGMALVEFEAMQGRKVSLRLNDLELLTHEMLMSNQSPADTQRSQTPEPDTTWSWAEFLPPGESSGFMDPFAQNVSGPSTQVVKVAGSGAHGMGSYMIRDDETKNHITATLNHWLLGSSMRNILKMHSLTVIVRDSQDYRNGEFENRIVSTIVNPQWRESYSIEVRIDVREKAFIPVHYLHPLLVSSKGHKAVVTEGELCGQIVVVKWVPRDDNSAHASVAVGTQFKEVPLKHLCKFR